MAGPKGYNAQALVAEGSGVIVTQEVTAHSAASPRLSPVLELLDRNLASLWESSKRSGAPGGSPRTQGTAARAT